MKLLGPRGSASGTVDVHDDGAGVARARQIIKRFGAFVIAKDETLDGYARNLRRQRLGERGVGTAHHGSHADDPDDGDQHGRNTPEGHLAPQATAIDDMIGFERHGIAPDWFDEGATAGGSRSIPVGYPT